MAQVVNGQIIPDIAGSFNAGYDRGQQQQFNRLAGQVAFGQGDQTANLAQAGQINPMGALQIQGAVQNNQAEQFQNQQTQQQAMAQKLSGAARYMLQALQSNNPAQIEGAYQNVRPALADAASLHGMPPPPPNWTPDQLPGIYQAAAAGSGTQKGVVLSSGAQLVDQSSGSLLANNPLADKIINAPTGANGEHALVAVNPKGGGQGRIVSLGPTTPSGLPINNDNMAPLLEEANRRVQSGEDPDQVQNWLIQQKQEMDQQAPSSSQAQPLAQGTPLPRAQGAAASKVQALRDLGASNQEIKGALLGNAATEEANAGGLSTGAITNASWDYILNGKLPPVGRGGAGQAQRTAILNNVSDIAQQTGVSPQELTTTSGRNKALQGSLNALQKRSDAMQGQEEAFKRNMDYALQLSNQLDRTGSPVVNKWLLGGKEALGDPGVSAFDASLKTVAADYARIMAGNTGAGGTPISTMDEALGMMRRELSDKQFGAVAGVLNNDIHNQQQAVQDQRGVILGHMQQFGKQPSQSSSIPTGAIQLLRSNPQLKAQFDAKYGQGASDQALGGGNGQ